MDLEGVTDFIQEAEVEEAENKSQRASLRKTVIASFKKAKRPAPKATAKSKSSRPRGKLRWRAVLGVYGQSISALIELR